jgi:glycosyltransferase involved in cell wall biosynthesis
MDDHAGKDRFAVLADRTPETRVLLCVHQFFPSFGAGTEVLVLSTAKALRSAGYVVHIVTCEITEAREALWDIYDYEGFAVHRIFLTRRVGRPQIESVFEEYENASVAPAFASILELCQPHVVHFFHLKNLTLTSLQSCVSRGVPTVFTPTDYWVTCRSCQLLKPWGEPHCDGPDEQAGNCLKHLIVNSGNPALAQVARLVPSRLIALCSTVSGRLNIPGLSRPAKLLDYLGQRKGRIAESLSQLDLILPPTRSLEAALSSIGIPAERVQLLRYAIEPPSKAYELIATSNKKRFTVGFIGTLVEHKGCHVLIEAMREFDRQDVAVKIYGSPTHYPAYFAGLKSSAGADDRINFCGTFPPHQIGAVLDGIDVLVIPSTWRENAPLVLLNALASGTPVIASDVPGITEYLHPDDDVILFPAGDSGRLAELLLACASADRQRNGSRVAGSSLESYASALHTAYSRLIKRIVNKTDMT